MAQKRFEAWQAPVFILADDDRGAMDRISEVLHPEWYYVTVTKPALVSGYAKRLPVAAVFLADSVNYSKGGSEALLRQVIEGTGKPVIILAERWSEAIAERWRKLGALDCLPHPTRYKERLELLLNRMQSLALAAGSQSDRSFVGPEDES